MSKTVGRRRKAPPMSLELIGVLEYRRDLFERKFGRPPQPGEPLFFDPEAQEPRRLPAEQRRRALAHVLALTGHADSMAVELVARW